MKNTPTKSVRETLARTLVLVQRSNSWCQGDDREVTTDSTGKSRTSYCMRGAICAAIGGTSTAADENHDSKLFHATEKQIIKTINKNPENYGADQKVYSVVTFNDNDQRKHSHVVRAIRDTLYRLQ